MDKFLEIVFMDYAENNEEINNAFEEQFQPILSHIKELVSENIYLDIEEILVNCAVVSTRFYAVEGMKLALDVMNGKYVPKM